MFKHLAKIFKQTGGNEDHQAIVKAVEQQIDTINSDTDKIIPEMNIKSSDGNWLDSWAGWFGLSRFFHESDDSLRQRIFNIVLDPSTTIPSIIMITKRILGQDTIVTVYEPYHDVRYFNVSTYSGVGHYEDQNYYRIGVIDVVVNKPITDELIQAIDHIRAAGVSVKFTYEVEEVVDMSVNDNPVGFITYESNHVVKDKPYPYAFSSEDPTIYSGNRNVFSFNAKSFELRADNSEYQKVKLSWGNINDADHYVVYRDNKNISGNLMDTSFIDESFDEYKDTYSYIIRAVFNSEEDILSQMKSISVIYRNLAIKSRFTHFVFIGDDGSLAPHPSIDTTDFIKVNPGEKITTYQDSGFINVRIAQYDDNKNFIGRFFNSLNPYTYVVPDNVFYIRISCDNNNKRLMVVRGSYLVPYQLAPEDLSK